MVLKDLPDSAMPDPIAPAVHDYDDVIVTHALATLHHTHIATAAAVMVDQIEEATNGAAFAIIEPGDKTRYAATIYDTARGVIAVNPDRRPHGRYVISFGLASAAGRIEVDIDQPAWSHQDKLITQMCGNAGVHTQVVAWIWYAYLCQGMNDQVRLPWELQAAAA